MTSKFRRTMTPIKPSDPNVPHAEWWWQTKGTADDLAIVPEHVLPAAYDELRKARFSWLLPFDLSAEQARAYLGVLNVRRDELLVLRRERVVGRREDDAIEGAIAQRGEAVARERLGVGRG